MDLLQNLLVVSSYMDSFISIGIVCQRAGVCHSIAAGFVGPLLTLPLSYLFSSMLLLLFQPPNRALTSEESLADCHSNGMMGLVWWISRDTFMVLHWLEEWDRVIGCSDPVPDSLSVLVFSSGGSGQVILGSVSPKKEAKAWYLLHVSSGP
ncbi:uncharacterized protein EV420DRAFT_1476144 [Desarmillaria tabescens]|uniref:Uncharacterized protein n=1 Tax=Armillaria tabescens TaxID=1929756 RepID=A0AA39NFL5_ARMTA|nr:uncharacterized protein EV420DRAFT_1476144 [Desarmillaria tabescens]KAK0464752.1 hypothetical protein EV420DRAFT_1476144 [Desarmillaria tabescens]